MPVVGPKGLHYVVQTKVLFGWKDDCVNLCSWAGSWKEVKVFSSIRDAVADVKLEYGDKVTITEYRP